MRGRALVIVAALCLVAGCTRQSRPRETATDLAIGRRWMSDTVEYRRLCFVPADSAVDMRRACVLRDQSP